MIDQKFFRNKKVLITGHTGFKGSWLTRVLLDWGAKVVGVSLEPNTQPNLFEILCLKGKIKNNFLDISDLEGLRKIFIAEKPEIVFHLAAQPLVRDSYNDPVLTFQTNTLGTAHVLDAIKELDSVKSAVMVTTDKVYENKEMIWPYRETDELGGHDPYSASKAGAELVIRSYIRSFFNINRFGKDHSTLIASVRAGNVVGGGDWSKDRLIPDIIRSFLHEKKEVIIRSPNSIRPWQHVLEPLSGYLLLAMRLYKKEKQLVGAWNFAPDESNFIKVEKIVKKAIDTFNTGTYSVKSAKRHETKVLKLDASKAREELSWKPILDLDQTMDWTFDWYKRFYKGDEMDNVTKMQIDNYFH